MLPTESYNEQNVYSYTQNLMDYVTQINRTLYYCLLKMLIVIYVIILSIFALKHQKMTMYKNLALKHQKMTMYKNLVSP